MSTTTPTTEKSTAQETTRNLAPRIGENKYGELYEFWVCESCDAIGGKKWQAREECTCEA